MNRRRAARSPTSGSGTTGDGTTRSAAGAPLTIAGLAASGFLSWATGTDRRRAFDFFALAMIETPLSALYSNCRGGRCLTIIGTEGTAIFLVAVVKAGLVARNYMHLRFEPRLIYAIALVPVLFAVILAFALFPDFVLRR